MPHHIPPQKKLEKIMPQLLKEQIFRLELVVTVLPGKPLHHEPREAVNDVQ
jgi:hypothetical protein